MLNTDFLDHKLLHRLRNLISSFAFCISETSFRCFRKHFCWIDCLFFFLRRSVEAFLRRCFSCFILSICVLFIFLDFSWLNEVNLVVLWLVLVVILSFGMCCPILCPLINIFFPAMKANCQRGASVNCGEKIRLKHLTSGCYLHSHLFNAPLSRGNQVGCHRKLIYLLGIDDKRERKFCCILFFISLVYLLCVEY